MSVSEKEKRTKSLQKKLRTKIFFIGIVAAALVVIVVASSLAWFAFNGKATVDPLRIKVQKVDSLYIRGIPNDGTWQQSIFVSYYPLKPMCGDGINFYVPVFTDDIDTTSSPGLILKTKKLTSYVALSNGETISSNALVKEFEVKTDIDKSYIYISSSSYLSADFGHSNGSSLNSSALSTAHIAGAMRVALYRYDNSLNNYKLICYWIPNVYAHLTKDDDDLPVAVQNYTVDSDGICTYYDSWQEGDTDDQHDNESSAILVVQPGDITNNAIYKNITIDSSGFYRDSVTDVLYVWDLKKAREAHQYIFNDLQVGNTVRMKLIIWLEGTDRECQNALLGGKMNFWLSFEQRGEDE